MSKSVSGVIIIICSLFPFLTNELESFIMYLNFDNPKGSKVIMNKVIKLVSQSSKVEDTPDTGTNLFFLGSHVDQSHMYRPLDVITGQLGLGLDTQLEDLHHHVDLKFPSFQRLGSVEQETLQIISKILNDNCKLGKFQSKLTESPSSTILRSRFR